MKHKFKFLMLAALVGIITVGCSSGGSKSGSLYDDIMSRKEIVFATEGTYAPFSFHDEQDKLTGYDVEVAEAVAKKLGVKATFVETKWDGIIAGLDAKKYDVVANQVGITPEREKKYLFSTPYSFSQGVIIVAQDTTDINSFEDLKGRTSAQTMTSNWAKVVEEYGGEVIGTEGFDQSISLVVQGRADATVNDNVTYLDYVKKQPNTKVKITATSSDVSKTGLLMRKGEDKLQQEINKALDELAKDGTLTKISMKYFNFDISTNSAK